MRYGAEARPRASGGTPNPAPKSCSFLNRYGMCWDAPGSSGAATRKRRSRAETTRTAGRHGCAKTTTGRAATSDDTSSWAAGRDRAAPGQPRATRTRRGARARRLGADAVCEPSPRQHLLRGRPRSRTACGGAARCSAASRTGRRDAADHSRDPPTRPDPDDRRATPAGDMMDRAASRPGAACTLRQPGVAWSCPHGGRHQRGGAPRAGAVPPREGTDALVMKHHRRGHHHVAGGAAPGAGVVVDEAGGSLRDRGRGRERHGGGRAAGEAAREAGADGILVRRPPTTSRRSGGSWSTSGG